MHVSKNLNLKHASYTAFSQSTAYDAHDAFLPVDELIKAPKTSFCCWECLNVLARKAPYCCWEYLNVLARKASFVVGSLQMNFV